MAHRLLHKLSFTRKCSVCAAPTVLPGTPSDNAAVPFSQEPPLSSSAVARTSPSVHPHYSNPPMPLVPLPPPDFNTGAATSRSRQRVNLFKKLFGKQPAPPGLTASKTRRRTTWERDMQEFRVNAGAEVTDENSRKSSPKLNTPTSWELHWDCADTEYRGSVEVKTPVFSNEGLALCDLPSPTDTLDPIDYRSVCRTIKSLMPKGIPPPRGRSNGAKEAYPPAGSSAMAARPSSPSGYSINNASTTSTCEQNVVISQMTGSPNEEDPGSSDPLFSPPKRRESRPTSLVFRPTSSGGPALQTLSPPPVKASLAVRRGTTLPSRLPTTPSPRSWSRRSIGRSQLPCESAHNVSAPGSPASLTPEEGLVQLQIRTQQADSSTPLGYRRSFKHIRGLNPRTHPTSPALPQISTTSVPIKAHPGGPDNTGIRTRSEESLIESISQSSSDELGPLSTPPDDAIPDVTITRSRKGSSASPDNLRFSARAGADKYASSFLDFEPSTPLSPPSPAVQSPFSIAQSRLFIRCVHCSPESADGSSEQSDAYTSVSGDEEQRDWGARKGASPIQSPRISKNPMRGSKTRPGPVSLGTRYTDSRNSFCRGGVRMSRGGTTGACRTRVVGQSQRRRKSGARCSHRPRSRGGNTATRRSCNRVSGGTTNARRGVDKGLQG